jgi:hypothetical protein
MSKLNDSILPVVALKALGKIVAERGDEAKACALEDMADAGAATVHAELPDGTRVGTVSYVAPAPHASVASSDILIAWLRVNRPVAIEEVVVPEHTEVRVRPEFLEGLTVKGAVACTEDGEVVPGVAAVATKPYLAVKSLKVDAILAAMQRGALDAGALLELPSGAQS